MVQEKKLRFNDKIYDTDYQRIKLDLRGGEMDYREYKNELLKMKSMKKKERADYIASGKAKLIGYVTELHNLAVYRDMPEGYSVIKNSFIAPPGTEMICNMCTIKSGKRKMALLITA